MAFLVRNISTGLVHQVPAGHWSLTKPDEYEVIEVEKPDPKPKADKPKK